MFFFLWETSNKLQAIHNAKSDVFKGLLYVMLCSFLANACSDCSEVLHFILLNAKNK